MTVTLPPGVYPTPIFFEPRDALALTRVTRYRFQLLDREQNFVAELDSVLPGGSVEWQLYTAVKGGGRMTVRDTGTDYDWLDARIAPVAVMSSTGTEPEVEQPLGVFLVAAAPESWDDISRLWELELVDKLSILDTAIAMTEGGMPVPFVAPVGANIIDTVVGLIESQGESAPAVEPDPQTLPNALTWEVGTSLLQIANDLLKAGNYFSLWCDGAGQFQCTPHQEPRDRSPVYESMQPFTPGEGSVMSPEWRRERLIYDVPNVYVAISQGDGESEPLIAVATNEDPASPYSYPSRGRWHPRVLEGVEVASMEALESIARQGLAQTTAVTAAVTAEHLFLPDMLINTTVRFTNPAAGVDYLCLVTRLSVPLDPVGLCSSDLREVVE